MIHKFIWAALAAALSCAPALAQPAPAISPAAPAEYGHRCFGCGSFGKTYVNTAGHVVPRPVLSDTKPAGATARCADLYWSFSEERAGACQGHGGVSIWLKR